jgi:hypothetical protein
MRQEARIGQGVVDHDFGGFQQLAPAHGDETRIAGAGADEEDDAKGMCGRRVDGGMVAVIEVVLKMGEEEGL